LKRAEIEEQNRYLLRVQYDFRRAADIVTDALMIFEEVEAIAVIGSGPNLCGRRSREASGDD
jgi:hypothetical protein